MGVKRHRSDTLPGVSQDSRLSLFTFYHRTFIAQTGLIAPYGTARGPSEACSSSATTPSFAWVLHGWRPLQAPGTSGSDQFGPMKAFGHCTCSDPLRGGSFGCHSPALEPGVTARTGVTLGWSFSTRDVMGRPIAEWNTITKASQFVHANEMSL